jgi:glycosyltransferase involved in cell wall biosynthesis
MIDILLATYNGEAFLSQQLDSLLRQTEQDFCVLVQDDGSTDGTMAILSGYVTKYPNKIRLLSGLPHEKGPRGNFLSLLCASQADYVMFCDQDDVWHPDKIALTFHCMREGEREYGASCPLLTHTDLRVVDRELNPIAPSFLQFQKLDGTPRLPRLLTQNSVTGCTTMLNRALMDLMKNAPAGAMLMHDWWAALCAQAFGHILLAPQATIDYRQHGKNQLGATGFDAVRDAKRAASQGADIRRRLHDTYRQADAFLQCYEASLPKNAAQIIRRYTAISQKTKTARAYILLRHGYLKKGVARWVGQILFC